MRSSTVAGPERQSDIREAVSELIAGDERALPASSTAYQQERRDRHRRCTVGAPQSKGHSLLIVDERRSVGGPRGRPQPAIVSSSISRTGEPSTGTT